MDISGLKLLAAQRNLLGVSDEKVALREEVKIGG